MNQDTQTTQEKAPHRFSRVELLLGADRLAQLQGATVMVLGLGGVGGSCAVALARGGVGTLILLDRDTVEITNINRQAVAYTSTIDRVKANVMCDLVYEINPDCQVYADQVELTQTNIADVFSRYPRPDYVIDCIDMVGAKVHVAVHCQNAGLPLIAAMGAGNKLDPTQLTFADIYQTKNCNLSRVMRREYKKAGIQQLDVIFSTELPVKIQNPASAAKQHTLGTMSYMPPIMGEMLASQVIRHLVGLS